MIGPSLRRNSWSFTRWNECRYRKKRTTSWGNSPNLPRNRRRVLTITWNEQISCIIRAEDSSRTILLQCESWEVCVIGWRKSVSYFISMLSLSVTIMTKSSPHCIWVFANTLWNVISSADVLHQLCQLQWTNQKPNWTPPSLPFSSAVVAALSPNYCVITSTVIIIASP